MAARVNTPKLNDGWKNKIQATHIVTRLVKFFDGDLQLTRDQITVALALLRKVAPDLSNVKMESNSSDKVVVNIMRFTDAKPLGNSAIPQKLQ